MKKVFKWLGYFIVSMLLLCGVVYLFWQWQYKSENEIFVMPNDFEGVVIVLFDEANGKAVKYDGEGNRVYEVPKSGILKTQFKQEKGWGDTKYMRKNGQNIRYLWPSDKVWKDTINANSIYKDSVYVFTGRSSKKAIWFSVGHPQDSEYWAKIMSKKWEPYSETNTLKEGESTGKVRHNKLFDE